MRSQDGLHCEANSRSLRSGEGQGEGTLRKPARWRTAVGVGRSERRKTKLDASQSAESRTVASRLPPHPGPLPQGEGTRHPRCDKSRRSVLSKAQRTVLPLLGERAGVRGKGRSANQRAGELPLVSTTLSEGKQSSTPAKAPRP